MFSHIDGKLLSRLFQLYMAEQRPILNQDNYYHRFSFHIQNRQEQPKTTALCSSYRHEARWGETTHLTYVKLLASWGVAQYLTNPYLRDPRVRGCIPS